jgi:thermostable 8-oxoguanine DNA glycosylase
MIVDDAFIGEWSKKYAEHDDDEYNNILSKISKNTSETGTISKDMLVRIINWKAARAKGYVDWRNFGKYVKTFSAALSAQEKQKISIMDDLPGIGIPVASAIMHFVYPQNFPIVDFRTVEALKEMGYLDKTKSTHHFRDTIFGYEDFRQAILGIAKKCPRRSLREIDRALFAYHKVMLDSKSNRRQI